jgi:6-phospho-3-hexuloisomerase
LKFKEILDLILSEVKGVLSRVDEKKTEKFIEAILEAKKIFLIGQGRSGLVARCFAIRLMQMGFPVYVVGETITPAIEKGDLLIACSSSGKKHLILEFSSLAKEKGVIVCILTACEDSPLSRLGGLLIKIPVSSKESTSGQPLGSLFEQSLLFYLEGIVLSLMRRMNISEGEMRKRHANLE